MKEKLKFSVTIQYITDKKMTSRLRKRRSGDKKQNEKMT